MISFTRNFPNQLAIFQSSYYKPLFFNLYFSEPLITFYVTSYKITSCRITFSSRGILYLTKLSSKGAKMLGMMSQVSTLGIYFQGSIGSLCTSTVVSENTF